MATFEKRHDYHVPTDYFIPSQPNPTETNRFKKSTKGDCVIRAFCLAAGITWLEAFDILTAEARATYNVPNDKAVYKAVFLARGYERVVPKVSKGKKRMTAEDFCKKHRRGRYILRLANHLCAVVDGKVLDSWNCGNMCVYHYYIVSEN